MIVCCILGNFALILRDSWRKTTATESQTTLISPEDKVRFGSLTLIQNDIVHMGHNKATNKASDSDTTFLHPCLRVASSSRIIVQGWAEEHDQEFPAEHL